LLKNGLLHIIHEQLATNTHVLGFGFDFNFCNPNKIGVHSGYYYKTKGE